MAKFKIVVTPAVTEDREIDLPFFCHWDVGDRHRCDVYNRVDEAEGRTRLTSIKLMDYGFEMEVTYPIHPLDVSFIRNQCKPESFYSALEEAKKIAASI